MPQPAVWVVTPVHNRRRYTEPFLECLSRQTWSDLHVVVFDDGSGDGTEAMIRRRFPPVTVLRGDGNVWWTASVNRGIRHALQSAGSDDYILVMNDDVEVDPGFVETLVTFATRHPRSLVGALSVDISGEKRIEDGGVRINWWTAKYRILNQGRSPADFPKGHAERASYLNGRGCLIPVHVLRTIGLYDEKHFLNCGDTELPVRAARRGFDLYVCYDAILWSHVSAVADRVNSARRYSLGMLRNYYFGIKSYSRLRYRFYFARTAAGHNPVRFLSFFLGDLARITGHFFRGLRISSAD